MHIFAGYRAGRRLAVLALAALVAAAAGCSRSTGTVTGTVSYKGTKLKGGNVIFTPANGTGQPVQAGINEDGTYTIEKCPTGPMKVAVQTEFLKPAPANRGMRQNKPPPGAGGNPNDSDPSHSYKIPDPAENAKRYVAIPPKYEDPASSGLTVEVKGGKQPYDINLE